MKNVLVLCTGNSCRSQMAEGYLRHFAGEKANIYSAGIEAHGVNRKAIDTMLEDGIDISQHSSKTIEQFLGMDFNFVITVCDNAKERCPIFPSSAIKIHQDFPDPARAAGTDEEIRQKFRQVREMIKKFSVQFVRVNL